MSKFEILTDRDKQILELVEHLRMVDVYTVDKILFSNTKGTRVAQRRLANLVEFRRLNRWRMNQISNYVYYLGKRPKNIEHGLLLSHFVANLIGMGAEIKKIKREWLITKGIRVDLFLAYTLNDKSYISIVEVENSKSFQGKYDKLEAYFSTDEYKEIFPQVPQIICVSDKGFTEGNLEVIKIDTKFNNMNVLEKEVAL